MIEYRKEAFDAAVEFIRKNNRACKAPKRTLLEILNAFKGTKTISIRGGGFYVVRDAEEPEWLDIYVAPLFGLKWTWTVVRG